MKAVQPQVIVAVDPHKRINAVNVVDSVPKCWRGRCSRIPPRAIGSCRVSVGSGINAGGRWRAAAASVESVATPCGPT